MIKKILLFLLFTINFSYSQNIDSAYLETIDSIRIDTSLTDSELFFKDSIAKLNQENLIFVNSRKEYNSGLELFNNGNSKDAIVNFTNAIFIDSSFSEAYFYRGKCYELFDTSLAILDYQIAFSLDSMNLSPLYSVAKIQSNLDINKAIKVYNSIISYNSEESKAYYEIGVLFYRKHNIDSAIQFFTNSIELNKDPRAFNDRASCYRVLDSTDLAIKDYLKAITLNPELTFIYNNLASAYRKQGDSEKALSYYSLAISKDKNCVLAYNNRGSLYLDLNDLDKALNDIEIAISINKDYSLAYNNKGVIFHRQEKYAEALSCFDKAITLNNNYAKAYLNRGITRQMMRDEYDACNDWMKAKELDINIANKYLVNDCN